MRGSAARRKLVADREEASEAKGSGVFFRSATRESRAVIGWQADLKKTPDPLNQPATRLLGVMADRGLKPTATFGGRSATKDKYQ